MRILRKVITAFENNQSMPSINLRESISEILKAWNYEVTDRTIHNSFAKAGFFLTAVRVGKYGGRRRYSLTRNENNMYTSKGKIRNYGIGAAKTFNFLDSEVQT
ncbi:DDE-1 domain-containing protein [Nephila pilipes]|uniref:DDE-1 domain-containing protein n=1 Tax=Nephila pilipes TaxID=299642 RepID=A0A8X6QUV0_NEPPI|nr:DDE-1 domain-containing protein [Nephila pilipes]